MPDARALAALGTLIGEPARARMLTALMSGTALTATELALAAEISPATASSHLAKLTAANLLTIERQGRYRYYRLADHEVAEVLEHLGEISHRRVRTGPANPAMRAARVCYDHLAGEKGVWLFDALKQRALIAGRDALEVTQTGAAFFARFGIDLATLSASRRPLCRTCLDWSERRHHLAGGLGAAMLERIFALKWARRELDSRVVVFSASGERSLAALLS